jgi:hypothetical protein
MIVNEQERLSNITLSQIKVNEHERLSNITLSQLKVKEERFYCCTTFHSHSRHFSNKDKLYPKSV